jgi:HK97 gp10 family phage protein
MKTTMRVEGLVEVQRVFEKLQMDIGDKAARSKILIPAVKKAMIPVKATAMALSPDDTGALDRSMKIIAKRPSKKDIRSKYINEKDTVIGVLTAGVTNIEENKSASGKKKGFDKRAIAQEFGTANNTSRSYLRPALETNAEAVTNLLGVEILKYINTYKRA